MAACTGPARPTKTTSVANTKCLLMETRNPPGLVRAEVYNVQDGVPMGLRRQYYHGPVSDHFDGERFVDPNGMRLKRRRDVLRWWLRSDRGRWPAHIPNGFADRPPPRVDGNGWRICYVGHASLLIQTADHNLLIDP